MLIKRKDGHLYVPLDFWMLFIGSALVLPLVFGDWKNFAIGALFCITTGYLAADTTLLVTRTSSILRVSGLWNRKQIGVSGAILAVEHAYRSYYRVMLTGGTAVTGAMLPGHCIRVAKRIGVQLDLPVQVSQDLRDQLATTRKTIWVIVLSIIVIPVVGLLSYLLFMN